MTRTEVNTSDRANGLLTMLMACPTTDWESACMTRGAVMSVRVNYESEFIRHLTEDSDETRGSQQEIQSYPLLVCGDAKLTFSSSNSCM
jgi:hypothetical protein